MKILNNAMLKWSGMIASIALLLGVGASTQLCVLWYHQPKVPQGMEKFKK